MRSVNTSSGVITTIAGSDVGGFSGDGGAGTSAELNGPEGVAVDGGVKLYIADAGNSRVRVLDLSTGTITTIAGSSVGGFSGDGGAGTSAKLNGPGGVAVDAAGNVFIADSGNNRVRKVAASTGIITTIAGSGVSGFSGDGGAGTSAELAYPCGIAVDAAGNVFIADVNNYRVRKVAGGTGIITTIAGSGVGGIIGDGGAGTSAALAYPQGVAVDAAGDVYIADYGNNLVFKVTSRTGTIATIVGTGVSGFNGDGGSGKGTQLNLPFGVAVGTTGAVFIADAYNNRLRVFAPTEWGTPSSTPTPSPKPTPSSTPYCWPPLFRALPRTDLVGTLVGSALFPGMEVLTANEGRCRQACCDAPVCDAYTFAATTLLASATGTAPCFLYTNVTALVPNSFAASGALLSAYS